MKKIVLLMLLVTALFSFSSCSKDEWGNDNAEMEHIYYYGLGNVAYPGGNELKYKVSQGDTIGIPTYFFSAYSRSYSPEVWYYVQSSGLVLGQDFQVVDAQGQTLNANADGGYSMTWPNARQGIQLVYVKVLSGAKGSIRLMTQKPDVKMDANDVSTTTITKTADYEVRAFTENYYVTINVN
jgi:hypothetical protein